MDGDPPRRPRRPLWDRWPWPFVWILVVPVLTLWPTSHYLFELNQHGPCIRSGSPPTVECPTPLVVLGLAPGLLNLVPALWLRSSGRTERAAAAVATLLGAIRVVIPAIGYAQYGSHVDLTLRGNGGAELASGIISLILWVGSLLIFVLFAVGVAVTSLLRLRAGTPNR